MNASEFFHESSPPAEPHAVIQWQGTQVCMDFACKCGVSSHWDADFAFAIKCPGCGTVYELATRILCRENQGYDGHIEEQRDTVEAES